MVYVNKKGYLERGTSSGKNPHSKGCKRDWWLIKGSGSTFSARISLGTVAFFKKYLGKRVKFKVILLK